MKIAIYLLLLPLFAFAYPVTGQERYLPVKVRSQRVHAQTAVCTLTTYFWDEATGSSTSWSQVGEFQFEDESVSKVFRHNDPEMNISVGVSRIDGISKKSPKRFRVAISFQDKVDAFDDIDRAEAETLYDRRWRWLSVSKSRRIEGRVHTFRFGCERVKARG